MKVFAHILIIALFLSVFSVYGATSLDSCNLTLNYSGSPYTLTDNITTTSNCFRVISDNITFDGNGHHVMLTTTVGTINGFAVVDYENITIRNVDFINFDRGLYLEDAKNSLFENINIVNYTSSGGYGLYLIFNTTNNVFNNVNLIGTGTAIFEDLNTDVKNDHIYDNIFGTIEWIEDDILIDLDIDQGVPIGLTTTVAGDTYQGSVNISDNNVSLSNDLLSVSGGKFNTETNITLKNIDTSTDPSYILSGAEVCTDCTPYTDFTPSVSTDIDFNVPSWTSFYTLGLDTQKPSMGSTITHPIADKTYGTNNVPINFTATDDSSEIYQFRFYNGTQTVVNTSPGRLATTMYREDSESFYSVTLIAEDKSGNIRSITRQFRVDTSGPTLDIINPTGATITNTTNISIDFSASDGDFTLPVELWYDNGTANSSKQTNTFSDYVILDDGNTYDFTFYANDTGGNIDTKSISFTVADQTPPTLSVSSPINTIYDYRDIDVNFSYNDNSGLLNLVPGIIFDNETQLIDENVNDNTTTFTNIKFSEGVRQLTIYVEDSRGNNANQTVEFTVDITDPTVTIIEPENKTYYGSSVPLDVIGNDNIEFDNIFYSLNGSSFNETEPSLDVSDIGTGTHFLQVYSTDTAGHQSTIKNVTFTLEEEDLTLPTIVNISVSNNSYYNTQLLDINFSATDADAGIDSMWMYINGIRRDTNSRTSELFNDQQRHNVTFYANDTQGNVASEQYFFWVDTLDPSVSINTPTNMLYSNISVQVNVSASDAINISELYYYFNGNKSDNVTVSNGLPATQIINISTKDFVDETNNTITAVVVDVAGNNDTQTVEFEVIDPTINQPFVNITAPLNDSLSPTSSIPVSVFASDNSELSEIEVFGSQGNSFSCSLSESSDTCDGTLVFEEGNHSITAIATDVFNKTNSTTIYFAVDDTPPVITIYKPNESMYNTTSVFINASAIDNTSVSYIWFGDGETNFSNSSLLANKSANYSDTYTFADEQTHTIYVFANDSFGHESNESHTFTVNTTGNAPNITVQSPVDGYYLNSSVGIIVNLSDNSQLDKFWFNDEDGFNITLLPSISTSVYNYVDTRFLADGEYNFTYYVRDIFGKVNSSNVSFIVDTQDPIIQIFEPVNTTYYANSIPIFNASITDNLEIDTILYYVNGTINNSINISNFEVNNTYNITIIANDTAGRNASESVIFTLKEEDNEGPIITIINPLTGFYNLSSIDIEYNVTDGLGSGVSTSWFTVNDDPNKRFTNPFIDYPFYNDQQTYKLTFYANDTLGNLGNTTEYITIDRTNPLVNITSLEDGAQYDNLSLLVNITATDGINVSELFYYFNGNQSDNVSITGLSNTQFINWTMYDFTDETNNTLTAIATDVAGNTDTQTIQFEVIDPTVNHPTIDIITPDNNSLSGDSSITFNVNATDNTNLSRVTYSDSERPTSVDMNCNEPIGNKTSCSITRNFNEGNHNATITAIDVFGKTNTSIVHFHVDATPPTITVIQPNVTYTDNNTIDIIFNATDISGVAYTWFSTQFENYTPQSGNYSDTITLADETLYNITFYANDTFNYTRAISRELLINTSANKPNITLISPVAGEIYTTNTIPLTVNMSDNSFIDKMWYQDENNNNLTLYNPSTNVSEYLFSTPRSFSQDGVYNFTFYVRDSFGKMNSTNVSFIVDTTPPTITIHSPISMEYNTTTILLNATGTDSFNISHAWYNNGSINSTPVNSSNLTFDVSSVEDETSHTWTVYMNDTNNLVGSKNVTFSVLTPDVAKPFIEILSPQNNELFLVDTFSVEVNVTDSRGIDKIRCKIVGDTSSRPCENSTIFEDVIDGEHTIVATATDTSGNENSSYVNVTVDTTNPTLNVHSPVNKRYNKTVFNISFSASDAFNISSIWYINTTGNNNTVFNQTYTDENLTISTNDIFNYTREINFTDNTTQQYIFGVTDTNGRTTTTSVAFSINLDDILEPIINVTAPIDNHVYGSKTIPVNFTATDNKNISYLWFSANTVLSDKKSYDSLVPSLDYVSSRTFTTQGEKQFIFVTNDTSGFSASEEVTIFIDENPPIIDLLSPTDGGFYFKENVSVIANVTSFFMNETTKVDLDDFILTFDGVNYTNVTNTTLTQNLSQLAFGQTYTISLYANDTIGNNITQNFSFTLQEDTDDPVINVTSPINGTYYNQTVLIDLNITDLTSQTQTTVLVNETVNFTYEQPINLTLNQGLYNITIITVDEGSNEVNTTSHFTIDEFVPQLFVNSTTNTTYDFNKVLINFTATDFSGVSHLWFGNQTDILTITNESNITQTIDLDYAKQYNFTYYANDSSGKINSTSVVFSIVDEPNITVYSPINASSYKNNNITVSFSNISVGVPDSKWFEKNNSPVRYPENSSLLFTKNQSHTLYLFANNTYGALVNKSVTFFVEKPPINNITILSPNSTNINSLPVNLSFIASVNGTQDSVWFSPSTDLSNKTFTSQEFLSLNDNQSYEYIIFTNNSDGFTYNQSVVFSVATQGDTIAPEISVNTPSSSYLNESEVTLNFSATDNVNLESQLTLWYENQTGNYTYTQPVVINTSTEGDYYYMVYANDTFGNEAQQNVSFSIDRTTPSVVLNQTNETIFVSKLGVPMNLTFSENLSELLVSYDGYTFDITDEVENNQLLTNLTIFSYANTTFTFTFTDMVGLSNSTSFWFNPVLNFSGSTSADYDGDSINNSNDSITGFSSNVQTNINPLLVYVNGSSNLIQNASNETIPVEFISGTTSIISFEDNLKQTPLNLSEVIVMRDLTSNQSNLLIRGLHPSNGKNVTIQLTGDFDTHHSICVKDSSIFSISQISSDCTGTNETYIKVNDSDTFGSYNVKTNGSNVTVGLTQFTAVKQMCTENWQSTGSYTACSGGSKSLIYTDANSCGTEHLKPSSTTTSGCTVTTGGSSPSGGSPSGSPSGNYLNPDDDEPEPLDEDIDDTDNDDSNEEDPVIVDPDPRPTEQNDINQNTTTSGNEEEGFWSSFNIGAILVSTNALVAYLTVFVLLGVVGAVFVVRQHAVTQVKPPVVVKLADDPYPQLTDYVRRELAKGISEKRLRLFLLKTEWNAEDIDRAFEKVREKPY